MNETKKCLFCESNLNEHKIIFYEREGLDILSCKKCMIKYIYFKSGKLAFYSIYKQINGKIYNWSFNDLSNRSTIRYINAAEDELTYEYLEESLFELEHTLISVDNTPKITPDNIEHKLKTYLLFL